MNIAEVKAAQKTITEAKKELEQIVKKHLETEELKPSFSWTEGSEVENFTLDIKKGGLNIIVLFEKSSATGDYEYSISCAELEVLFHRPPTSNECTAQGTLKVKYDVKGNEGMREEVKLITMRQYM